MDTNELSDQIKQTRERLSQIEEIRAGLPAGSFAERAELLDEEHRLTAQLSDLLDEASKAGVGLAEKKVAIRTDITRTADLPPK